MEHLELIAEKRTITGKQVKQLRNEGVVPAVVFSHKIGSIPVQIPEKELRLVLGQAGTNRLIALKIKGDKKPTLALAREIQRDVLNGAFLHVDFQAVVMTERIRTHIALNFINESPAVTGGDGMLLYSMDSIEVESLPSDLISSIEVDLSALKEIDDTIYVKDLQVPTTSTVLSHAEDMIVRVSRLALEPEEEILEEGELEVGEVEVIRKGKAEDEEAE